MKFRVRVERERGYLIRFWINWVEVAYISLGLSGLQADIEFPSDWHENRIGWVRLGLGFAKVGFAFPWRWTVPDHYQCSGPTYGFQFFEDLFWLRYGKNKGTRNDPIIAIHMPWSWRHKKHEILSAPESHPYTYTLRSGEVQNRVATIQIESRLWLRPWLPYRKFFKTIDVTFSDEVGERSGSWKGGCTGCSYHMLPGESALHALRRMEAERKF